MKKEVSRQSHRRLYLTTTLPYVNAEPHIGFAMEVIRADVIARAKKLQGYDVFFNTGTDEHGLKIYRAAQAAKKDTKGYVDELAAKFEALKGALGLSDDVNFIRTTDAQHVKAAQEFWRRVDAAGYIKKKKYQAKYCVGCELEKTESELVDGKCPIHPNLQIELIDEENYFFLFSAFKDRLLKFYADNPDFVIPDFRFNEIKSFVSRGLSDFSISRLASKIPWGVPVPGDENHVMYVWFDALVSYIAALGWPDDEEKFNHFWKEGTPTQYCGKDNLRQQSAMWQAMLMAAGLPNSSKIVINGFITGEGGVKMSKSLGNVTNPFDLVKEYGTDALRYFVCRELHPFEDSPYTVERFKESYNANLANGLGNLVSRTMKMAKENLDGPVTIPEWEDMSAYFSLLDRFEINKAADHVWNIISEIDKHIQETQPFKLVKTDKEKGKKIISDLVVRLYSVARLLNPILPATSDKLKNLIKENAVPEAPLFPRKE